MKNVFRHSRLPLRSRSRGGFTLVELLVVIAIILLLTVATIPIVFPAIASRRASEAARVTQAEFANARDRAVRSNAPAGVRLVKSVQFPGPYAGDPNAPLAFDASRPLAYDRMVGIESPPNYKEGKIFYGPPGAARLEFYWPSPGTPTPATLLPDAVLADPGLVVIEKKYEIVPDVMTNTSFPVPNPPTSWFGNLRQGDKFAVNGRTYTIAGPVAPTINGQPNTERIISVPEGVAMFAAYFNNNLPLYNPTAPANQRPPQFLILTNGEDDDGDGLIDETFDGINNDSDVLPVVPPATVADGRTDPGFDLLPAIDPATPTAALAVAASHLEFIPWATVNPPAYPNSPLERLISVAGGAIGLEYENEQPLGLEALSSLSNLRGHDYVIHRRPIPTQGATEFKIPGDTVIDATTVRDAYGPFVSGFVLDWRSRMPIGPAPNYNVEILFAPSGQVLQSAASSNSAPPSVRPFYHIWLAAAEDVQSPDFSNPSTNPFPLPFNLPTETSLGRGGERALKKERRLLTIFTRTGQIVSNSIEFFTDATGTPDPNAPYQDAQLGAREP